MENRKRKKKQLSPEREASLQVRRLLCDASKTSNTDEAVKVFDAAVSDGIRLENSHFQMVLNLLAKSVEVDSTRENTLVRKTEVKRIWDHYESTMLTGPTEGSFLAVIKVHALCYTNEDMDVALELLRQMETGDIPSSARAGQTRYPHPAKLRTLAPLLKSLSSMIATRSSAGSEAVTLYSKFALLDVDPTEEVFQSMLLICCELSNLADSERTFSNSEISRIAFGVLLDMKEFLMDVNTITERIISRWFENVPAAQHSSRVALWRAENLCAQAGATIVKNANDDSLSLEEKKWERSSKLIPWTTASTTINSAGFCSKTGAQLHLVQLSSGEKSALITQVDNLVCTSKKRTAQYKLFLQFCEEHGPFDICVDGANVGYYHQPQGKIKTGGGFSFNQIDMVCRHYESLGKNVLLILHRKYFKHIGGRARLIPSHMEKSWRERRILYVLEPGNNDDWYWMAAAVRGNGAVVSNDQMRDHHFGMLRPRHFLKWKMAHCINYDFDYKRPILIPPPKFSVRVQYNYRDEKEVWHFPIRIGTGEATSAIPTSHVRWLCASRKGVKRDL
eukprot:g4912.t1